MLSSDNEEVVRKDATEPLQRGVETTQGESEKDETHTAERNNPSIEQKPPEDDRQTQNRIYEMKSNTLCIYYYRT